MSILRIMPSQKYPLVRGVFFLTHKLFTEIYRIMKNIRIIIILILCAYGILFGGTKIPNEVMESINKTSLKYPAEIRLDWKKNQIRAYRNISPEHFGVPETISYDGYLELITKAREVFPDDFYEQFKMIDENISTYQELNELRTGYDEKTRAECEKILKKFYTDIKLWVNEYSPMCEFIKSDYATSNNMDEKTEQILKEKALALSKGRALAARQKMEEFISLYTAVRNFRKPEVSDEVIEDIRKDLQKEFPYDYERQLKELYVRAKKGTLSKRELNELKSLADIMKCVFIKRINNNYNATAVLVEIMGRNIILCTKEFIPNKFPCEITNNTGSIICDGAAISKDFKILALVPREIPKEFEPIKCTDTPIEKIKDLRMVTPTIEGTIVSSVAFSTRTTDLFSNVTYKSDLYVNVDTGVYYKNPRHSDIGTLVKIKKGVSLDRSLLFDLKTKRLVSIATDLNEDKTAFYSFMITNMNKRKGLTEIQKYMMRQFDIPVKELEKGNIDREVSFVDISLINKEENWEVFNTKKYFDTIAFLQNLKSETEEIAWFIEYNRFDVALQCRLFQRTCKRYWKDLFSRTTRESYLKIVKNFYLSLYQAMRSTYLRSIKYKTGEYYILNRFDIIATQQLLKNFITDFEGKFKNAQIESFLARDILVKVRYYYF